MGGRDAREGHGWGWVTYLYNIETLVIQIDTQLWPFGVPGLCLAVPISSRELFGSATCMTFLYYNLLSIILTLSLPKSYEDM